MSSLVTYIFISTDGASALLSECLEEDQSSFEALVQLGQISWQLEKAGVYILQNTLAVGVREMAAGKKMKTEGFRGKKY